MASIRPLTQCIASSRIRIFAALLLFLSFIQLIAAISPIPEVNKKTLSQATSKNDIVTLLLYGPGCQVCKNIEDMFSQVGEQLGNRVFFAKMEVKDPETGKMFKVQQNPTIVLIREGEIRPLNQIPPNPQYFQSIFKNLDRKNLYSLKSANDKRDFIDSNVYEPVKVIACATHSKEEKEVERAARVLFNEAKVGLVTDPKIARSLSLKCPGAVLMKPFEKKKIPLNTKYTAHDLVNFVDDNKKQVLIKMTNENSILFFGNGDSHVALLFVDGTKSPASLTSLETMAQVSREASTSYPQYTFAFADTLEMSAMAQRWLPSGMARPAVLILHDDLKYVLNHRQGDEEDSEEASFSSEHILDFLNEVETGAVKPFLKSAIVPSKQEFDNQLIKQVVADSFDEVVLQSKQNVFVTFTAPWCSHCNAMKPHIEALAADMSDSSEDGGLIFANFDGDQNDADPSYNIRGFPTILFFPANAKNRPPIVYNGQRDYTSIATFLNQQTKGSARSHSRSEL